MRDHAPFHDATLIVPVRALNDGKNRLAEILTESERRQLIGAMLEDVIAAATACPHVGLTLIVTEDDEAAQLSVAAGAVVLRLGGVSGYNNCVRLAVDHVRAVRGGTIIVCPADIPFVQPHELAAVAETASVAGQIALVPAFDGGTNCIGLSPDAKLDFKFGNSSFKKHLAEAGRNALKSVVLELPGMAFDIDTPRQLEELSLIQSNSKASRLAETISLGRSWQDVKVTMPDSAFHAGRADPQIQG